MAYICFPIFMPSPFEEWWSGIKCYPFPSVRPLSKFGVRSITFERLHRFNLNLVCWYIISKHKSSSIWVTIHYFLTELWAFHKNIMNAFSRGIRVLHISSFINFDCCYSCYKVVWGVLVPVYDSLVLYLELLWCLKYEKQVGFFVTMILVKLNTNVHIFSVSSVTVRNISTTINCLMRSMLSPAIPGCQRTRPSGTSTRTCE